MSFGGSSMGSGSRTFKRSFEFGRTYVVRPKGKHQATMVWLHGLGDNGARNPRGVFVLLSLEVPRHVSPWIRRVLLSISHAHTHTPEHNWSQLFETLPLPNIKWICPTAPSQPITLFGGFPSTAWFDVNDLSENAHDDLEGLDASAAHVASLLSTEPADIKLGVGGFSMGAATSLYSATCFALGKYGNDNPYPAKLRAVVGLSGWLPCSKNLTKKIEEVDEAARRAASLPIMLCHGKVDDVVPYKFGEKSSQALGSSGFQDVVFRSYTGLGHFTNPEEMDEVCSWLTSKLGLDGHS